MPPSRPASVPSGFRTSEGLQRLGCDGFPGVAVAGGPGLVELIGEGKTACRLLNRFQDIEGGVYDFRPDPVAGQNHDSVCF
jgi:hypothetical protein